MSANQEIKNALHWLYADDPCPWLVGYSGGKAERSETPGGHGQQIDPVTTFVNQRMGHWSEAIWN